MFRSFWDRDECFRILQELADKYKAGKGAVQEVPKQSPSHTFSPVIMPVRPSSLPTVSSSPVPGSGEHHHGGKDGKSDLRSILARRSLSPLPTNSKSAVPLTVPLLQQRQQMYAQQLGQQQQQHLRPRTESNDTDHSSFSSTTIESGHTPAFIANSSQQHHPHSSYFSQQRPADSSAIMNRGNSMSEAPPVLSHELSRQFSDLTATSEGGNDPSTNPTERHRAMSVDRAGTSFPSHEGSSDHTVSEQEEDRIDGRTLRADSAGSCTNNLVETDDEQRSREALGEAFREDYRRSLLRQRVVSNEVLPVSAQQFLDLFYEDNAVYSMKRYHEGTKDRNVILSPWAASLTGREGAGVSSFMREMRFMKHITNVLAGVKESRAIKVFRLKKFGDVGFIVMSSTRCEDIPAGNTFSVEEAVVVRTLGANRVAIDMSFEVKFLLRTILKMAIESNTNTDMRRWVKAFFDRTKAHCVHYAIEHPYVPPPQPPLCPPASPISSPDGILNGASRARVWERSTAEALAAAGPSTSGDDLAVTATVAAVASPRKTARQRSKSSRTGDSGTSGTSGQSDGSGATSMSKEKLGKHASSTHNNHLQETNKAAGSSGGWMFMAYLVVFSLLVMLFMLYALEKIASLTEKIEYALKKIESS